MVRGISYVRAITRKIIRGNKLCTCDHQQTVRGNKLCTCDHQQTVRGNKLCTCDHQPAVREINYVCAITSKPYPVVFAEVQCQEPVKPPIVQHVYLPEN